MEIKGKNVFISGPMTGIPLNNLPEFVKAHKALLDMGAKDIYDPAFEWYAAMAKGEPDESHEFYMRKTLNALTSSDCQSFFRKTHYGIMVLLDGWEASDGCITERSVAMACGIKVVEMRELYARQD